MKAEKVGVVESTFNFQHSTTNIQYFIKRQWIGEKQREFVQQLPRIDRIRRTSLDVGC
jgi:hypothetical protein